MRAILGLFEGVVTGAADGYGRMTGRPAATLLHLGPGLGNGIANLHNARRARTPIVNVVGDHATLPPGQRSTAGRRHREPGPARLGLVPVVVQPRRPGGRHRRRRGRRLRPARCGGHPGGAGRRLVDDRPAVRGPTPTHPGAQDVADEVVAERGQGAAVGGAGRRAHRGSATRRRGLTAASRVVQHGGEASVRDISRLARTRRRACRPSSGSATWPSSHWRSWPGARHLVLVGHAPLRSRSSPTPTFPGISCRRAARCTCWPRRAPERTPPERSRHWPTSSGRRPMGRSPGSRAARATDRCVDGGGRRHRHRGPASRTGPSWSDEANTSSIFIPGATAGGPVHDWLCLTGGAIG